MRADLNGKIVCVGILMAALFGCGRGEQLSATKGAAQKRSIAVVAMGGNLSCVGSDPRKMGMATNVMQFIQAARVATGVDPNYLISCHEFGSDLLFVTNFEPDTVRRAPLEKAYDLVRDVGSGQADLYMMGHSYGSWLTLKLSKNLGDDGFSIPFLASIDPISRKDCFFNKPVGCTGWPKDIDTEMRSAIQLHTGHWSNFYQKKTFFLHSAATNEADENFKIGKGHLGIEQQPEVWMAIAKATNF